MHEELKLEPTIPFLDEEKFKLLQADLQASLYSQEQTLAQTQHSLRHEFSDGRVVYAESARDAIRLCPVLGKLAVEDPEKVDALLMLAEICDDDLDFLDEPPEPHIAESYKEPAVADGPIAEVEAQVAEEIRGDVPVQRALATELQASLAEQQIRNETYLVHRRAAIIEQADSIVVVPAIPIVPKAADIKPIVLEISKENKVAESLTTAVRDEPEIAHEAVVKVEKPRELSQPEDSVSDDVLGAHYEKVNHKIIPELYVDQPQSAPISRIDYHSIAPVVAPQQANVEVRVVTPQVDANTIAETDNESVSPIVESVTVAKIDTLPDAANEQDSLPSSAELSQVLPTFFENPDAAVSRPQEIVERIETAQLDDILADVGRFVSQETTFETDENTIEAAVKAEEVQAAIQDIELLLNKIDSEIIDSTEKDLIDSLLQDPAIKQELVEKVMHLFRTLGYEQPDAQVRQLLDSYDTIFLKQSLENMCQMANGSKKLGRMFADGSDRQVRVSQYLATYIKQLISQQLLQTVR